MARFIPRIEHALTLCQQQLQSSTLEPETFERLRLGSSGSNSQVKAVVLMYNDLVYEAELKVHRPNSMAYHAVIKDNFGSPYKLQQLQDCYNYCLLASNILRTGMIADSLDSLAGDETFLGDLLQMIELAIASLKEPPRRSVDEHMSNSSRRCFHPPIPRDVVLSFFLRGANIVFAAYRLSYSGHDKSWRIVSRNSIDCVVPRIQKVLQHLSTALNTTTYLRDRLISNT